MPEKEKDIYHLEVYSDHSKLVQADGTQIVFLEGAISTGARERHQKITAALREGFLTRQVKLCRENPEQMAIDHLTSAQKNIIDSLVDSVTSEVGRAIIGLSILQLTIKAIEPKQSIRLHKGGGNSKDFGWQDGISMRSLDKNYLTPVLRTEGLLKLNADGFMMTRTLAENYPYTRVYKAAIRGAKKNWLDLVEELEENPKISLSLLQYFLSKLLNNAEEFQQLVDRILDKLQKIISSKKMDTIQEASSLIQKHMHNSSHAARIMEIAMHAFMQALQELDFLGDATLVPLSQMRSANKKHGNIGDIELKFDNAIIESWDAKYGKSYLRDELDELSEKLSNHFDVKTAGFVTSDAPQLREEIIDRISDLENLHQIQLPILSFDEWLVYQKKQFASGDNLDADKEIAHRWLIAYTESLSQKRTMIAPIDEPCANWLLELSHLFDETIQAS
jgi:hypothetical protein